MLPFPPASPKQAAPCLSHTARLLFPVIPLLNRPPRTKTDPGPDCWGSPAHGSSRSPAVFRLLSRAFSHRLRPGGQEQGPGTLGPKGLSRGGPRPRLASRGGSRAAAAGGGAEARTPAAGAAGGTREAPGLGTQGPGPPGAASSTLAFPCCRPSRARARCGKGEEVNPSCHHTGRSWKGHTLRQETPRSPQPRPEKPDTISRPSIPSPAPHQVVVLLIIAHEIILHVRHLGREGGGGGEIGDNLLPQCSAARRVTPSFSSPSCGF